MTNQLHPVAASILGTRRIQVFGAILALSLMQGCAFKGCSSSSSSSSSQATFNSADQAVDSLVAAARADDKEKLKHVLGPQADEILSSGDPVADKNQLETFLKAYDEKHQLAKGEDGSVTLVVGTSDWPMPIPIVQEDGKWRFDTAAGQEEMLNRRIGRNELAAIQSCLAVLDAQREYVMVDRSANGLREYAARFFSEPGKKNGLYWPTAEDEPPSPLGPLVAAAAEEGYTAGQTAPASPGAYHGYRFRILTQQGAQATGGVMDYMVGGKLIGGFAIVAWPADYDNSGIMTFIMNHEGVVYQRDLGEDTAKTAESMTAYDPDPEWEKVEAES